MGFTSPLLGDGSSIGPTVLWMENAETVDVVLVDRFIYKEYVWMELKKYTQDTNKGLGKGLYNKQEQS